VADNQRRTRMQQAMQEAGLDALILRLPENVLLVSGHWPMIGAVYCVLPQSGRPTCLVPACFEAEAAASLQDCDLSLFGYGLLDSAPFATSISSLLSALPGASSWRRIGYEGNFEVAAPSWSTGEGMQPAAASFQLLKSVFPQAELVDATKLLMTERQTKTRYEIERMAIASEISCFGLQAFGEAVEVGISGVELVARVEQAIMVKGTGYKGSVRVRGFAQVTTGAEETAIAYRPNVISTTRRMQSGDFAMLELGVVADGYWADRTRVRVAGTPREEQIRIFDTVCRAQAAAVSAIRPGVPAKAVDEAARNVIREAGFGSGFIHITGHGLGFGYHESSPILGPASSDILQEGMMTSVEPGIYGPTLGGCRIEDDVIVGAQGAVVLGPFEKSLA